jgi:hypothetical protein
MNGEWRLILTWPGYIFGRWKWFVNGEPTPYMIEWESHDTPPHISTLPKESPYDWNPPGSGQHISSL